MDQTTATLLASIGSTIASVFIAYFTMRTRVSLAQARTEISETRQNVADARGEITETRTTMADARAEVTETRETVVAHHIEAMEKRLELAVAVDRVQKSTNGYTAELLELTKKASHAQGMKDQREGNIPKESPPPTPPTPKKSS